MHNNSILDSLTLEEREEVIRFEKNLENEIDSSIKDIVKLLESILSLSNEDVGVIREQRDA